MQHIDYSLLPKPDVIETIDYNEILDDLIKDYSNRYPEHTEHLESDPVHKLLETAAYREVLLRQRINEAAHACMLPWAQGADLDNLGSLLDTERKTIIEANTEALPPTKAVYENDDNFRERIQLAFESITSAGSRNAYKYHALRADDKVKSIGIHSPAPCEVVISVLSSEEPDGTPSADMLATVYDVLNDEDIRPVTDKVTVQQAEIITFDISAQLLFRPGVGSAELLTTAKNNLQKYLDKAHKCGELVSRSGIIAALATPAGVINVILDEKFSDIVCKAHQAPFCTSHKVTEATY